MKTCKKIITRNILHSCIGVFPAVLMVFVAFTTPVQPDYYSYSWDAHTPKGIVVNLVTAPAPTENLQTDSQDFISPTKPLPDTAVSKQSSLKFNPQVNTAKRAFLLPQLRAPPSA